MAQYFMPCPCYHHIHLKQENRCTRVKYNLNGKKEALIPHDIDSFTRLGELIDICTLNQCTVKQPTMDFKRRNFSCEAFWEVLSTFGF